ncbi:MAG: hypothetical protein ACLQJR_12130 [Stellaceae bacterium]
MVGSLDAADAAKAANGEGIAAWRAPLRRFFCAGAALALLAGCSAAAPEPPGAATQLPAAPEPAMAAAAQPLMRPLTGLSAKEVVALLGEPDFRRAEPPAELWQYRSADCVLDLFLYGDAAGVHVIYSETRDRSLVQAGAGHCPGGGEPFVSRTRQTRL